MPEDNNRLTTYMDDSMNMFYDFELEADANWQVVLAGEDSYLLL